MAATVTRESTIRSAKPEHVPHWCQVGRFSTVEKAEAKVAELHSRGIDAVLSMIDGLCVLARNSV